jgi:hypothetical protein
MSRKDKPRTSIADNDEPFRNTVEEPDAVQRAILDEGKERFAPFIVLAGLLATVWLSLIWIEHAIWRSLESLRASRWPLISGMIESGDVSVRRAGITENIGTELADAQLAYSYKIGDEYHAGYSMTAFTDEQKAWDFVRKWQLRPVLIRHHPHRLETSYFRLKDQTRHR